MRRGLEGSWPQILWKGGPPGAGQARKMRLPMGVTGMFPHLFLPPHTEGRHSKANSPGLEVAFQRCKCF